MNYPAISAALSILVFVWGLLWGLDKLVKGKYWKRRNAMAVYRDFPVRWRGI